MQANEFTKILAGLGLGTGTGAVLTAIINTRSSRGKSRAEAADLLVGAAERVGKMNEELHDQITELKARQDSIHAFIYEYLSNNISQEELVKRMRELRK